MWDTFFMTKEVRVRFMENDLQNLILVGVSYCENMSSKYNNPYNREMRGVSGGRVGGQQTGQ